MSAESHILPISLAAPQVREYFREKFAVMEKNYWLLLALLAFALPVVGCSDDEDEEELVGNWVKVSDFDGVARCSAVTFTVGGKVYVAAGGYGGYKYRLNDLWAFNEDSGTWTQIASMEGVARTYAVGFSTELYGYVGLSYDGDNYLKDFWKYDEGSDKWEQITSIGGSKRIGASSFVIDDIAYVVGGENNSSVVTDFWSFDPVSGTWTEKREISNVSDEEYDDDYSTIPRSYGVAFTMYGLGYFTCGENAGSGRSRTDVRQGRQAGMSHRNSKPANHTAHFLAWMSSFTGLIMFSGSRIVSRSSCVRIPSSRTRSYTLRPVSIAFLAMLVEWS